MILVHPQDIDRFLAEDIGTGDLSAAVVPTSYQARASVITRETTVVCGQPWFDAVLQRLDPHVAIDWQVSEGEAVHVGALLCTAQGRARALLTAERTALNLLQTLSGTATLAREYARAVAGTNVKVRDTRKTLPGLRVAQKYAVRCGGCHNHRMGLYDGILIKENHIVAAGSIERAVKAAQALSAPVPVEVEVESVDELEQALQAGADRVLLDNFELAMMRQAVALNRGRAELEVSGNVGLENVRAIAETGVDYISVGALTKNVTAADLSMRVTLIV